MVKLKINDVIVYTTFSVTLDRISQQAAAASKKKTSSTTKLQFFLDTAMSLYVTF